VRSCWCYVYGTSGPQFIPNLHEQYAQEILSFVDAIIVETHAPKLVTPIVTLGNVLIPSGKQFGAKLWLRELLPQQRNHDILAHRLPAISDPNAVSAQCAQAVEEVVLERFDLLTTVFWLHRHASLARP